MRTSAFQGAGFAMATDAAMRPPKLCPKRTAGTSGARSRHRALELRGVVEELVEALGVPAPPLGLAVAAERDADGGDPALGPRVGDVRVARAVLCVAVEETDGDDGGVGERGVDVEGGAGGDFAGEDALVVVDHGGRE